MENNQILFTFSDLKKHIFKQKNKFILFFAITFFLSIFFLLLKEPLYEAESIYFDDLEKVRSINNLKDLNLSDCISTKDDAFSYFKTKKMLKKIVQKLALQISFEEKNFFEKKLFNIKKNLGFDTAQGSETIEFSNLFYDKKNIKSFYLKIIDEKNFEIYDLDNIFLIKGKINEKINFQDISFEINKIPKSYVNYIYKFKIDFWENAASFISGNLIVIKDKTNPNVIFLKIKTSSPTFSAKILNTLMIEYILHLKNESGKLFKNQIDTLNKRKKELEKKLDFLFQTLNEFLKKNVKDEGYIDFNSEINFLLSEKQNLQKKLSDNIYNLDRLKKIDLNRLSQAALEDNNLIETQSKIIDLKSELDDFKKIDKSFNDNENLLDDSFDKTFQNEITFLTLDNVSSYFNEYHTKKENVQDDIKSISNTIKRLKFDEFRFTFPTILNLDQTKNILDLINKLQNSFLYTPSEIEIFKQEYEIEKTNIIKYLEDKENSYKNDLKFINKKMFFLKKIKKELIEKEINSLSENLKTYILENINLLEEKKLSFEKSYNNISKSIQNLIEKIGYEKEINLKIEMTKNLIENIEKLIESKKIDENLKKINSRVLDLASDNISSKNRYFFYSLIISLTLSFIFFVISIYISLIKGLYISSEIINELSFDYFGKISKKCSGFEIGDIPKEDLETLRKLVNSIDVNQSIISIILSNGPSFVHFLAILLTISHKKVIVIETNEIHETKDENDGLYAFLEKEIKKPSIKKLEVYDYIPSGKKKYFSFELLKSFHFINFLNEIKDEYDLIIISSDASLDDAEARIFMDFSDKIILSINDEKIESIKKFINWAEDKNKLGFLTY